MREFYGDAAGNIEITAKVKQQLLDFSKAGVVGGVPIKACDQVSDSAIEFVKLTHQTNAGGVLAHPRAVSETCGAIVAGSSTDVAQSMAHGSGKRSISNNDPILVSVQVAGGLEVDPSKGNQHIPIAGAFLMAFERVGMQSADTDRKTLQFH